MAQKRLAATCALAFAASFVQAQPFPDAIIGEVTYGGGGIAVTPEHPSAIIKVFASWAQPGIAFAAIETTIFENSAGTFEIVDYGEMDPNLGVAFAPGPGIMNIISGQLCTIISPFCPPSTSNPAHIFTVKWTAADFTPRIELMSTDTKQFTVYINNGGASRTGTPTELALGINVIPAPASVAIAASWMLLAARRRRA